METIIKRFEKNNLFQVFRLNVIHKNVEVKDFNCTNMQVNYHMVEI